MPLCFVGFDKDVRPTKIKLYTHIMRHHAVPLTALWRFWRFRLLQCQEYDMQETGNTGQRQRHCGKDKKYHQTYPSPKTICKSKESLKRPPGREECATNTERKHAAAATSSETAKYS